jgi:hypothetical protein
VISWYFTHQREADEYLEERERHRLKSYARKSRANPDIYHYGKNFSVGVNR